MIQVNSDAVRIIGICVFILQLGIQQIDVDDTGLCCNPFDICGFSFACRHDVILLDLNAVFGVVPSVTLVIFFDIDRAVRIMVVAVLVVPAVLSLFSEIIQNRSEVFFRTFVCRRDRLFCFADQAAQRLDDKFILAAVISIVVKAIDDQCDVIILFDADEIDIETLCDFGKSLRCECLLCKQ